VVASADHLVLALPATDESRSLIDAAVLSNAKPTAHLINIARGSVLDQDALLTALDGGRLGFADARRHEPEPLPADIRCGAIRWWRLTPTFS